MPLKQSVRVKINNLFMKKIFALLSLVFVATVSAYTARSVYVSYNDDEIRIEKVNEVTYDRNGNVTRNRNCTYVLNKVAKTVIYYSCR
jgi:hypothetical protein